MYPSELSDLISCFKKMPGIGEKSAERIAFHCLEMNDEAIFLFADSLVKMKENIVKCVECGNISNMDKCDICLDENRDKKSICVVLDCKNIIQIEKLNNYNGLYFVLDGLISPIDGIGPDDINVIKLIERIKNGIITEVIMAIKPSIECETTIMYLSRILSDYDVVVSKLAHGIPIGADMEYIDNLTLEMAFEERKDISS